MYNTYTLLQCEQPDRLAVILMASVLRDDSSSKLVFEGRQTLVNR